MNNIILSTSYLPPIEYFFYLDRSDIIIIDQYETYKKQTYRNRCNIYTEKGDMSLSIPVAKPNGNHSKTNKIEIYYQENWQKKHWKAISSAYEASPFFLYYKDDFQLIFEKKFDKLIDFNKILLNKLIEITNIVVDISYSDDFIKPNSLEGDLRFKISPKELPTLQNFPQYTQVFCDRHGFIKNLSIIDLLFNLGPETLSYIKRLEL